MSLEIRYFVPFKASKDISEESAMRDGQLAIDGIAIDTSVNANKWQVPSEDLDFIVSSLKDAQLRVDHSESVHDVVGNVPECNKLTELKDPLSGQSIPGEGVAFKGVVGEAWLIPKILNGYVNHVSIQIDSDDVECSKCKKQTRQEGLLVHLCAGAWEIIHKPKVRELSIVASPAYKNTAFKPASFAPEGFAAAMNANQAAELQKQQALMASRDRLSLKLKLMRLQTQFAAATEPAETEQSLRKKLTALLKQQKELSDKYNTLWNQQNKESELLNEEHQEDLKPINDKYAKLREELSAELAKLQTEIDITKQVIAREMTATHVSSPIAKSEQRRFGLS